MTYMGKEKKMKECFKLLRSIRRSGGQDLATGEEVLAGIGEHSIGVEEE